MTIKLLYVIVFPRKYALRGFEPQTLLMPSSMAFFQSKASQLKNRAGTWFSRAILPPYLPAHLDLCSFENTSRYQACATAALFPHQNREKDEPAKEIRWRQMLGISQTFSVKPDHPKSTCEANTLHHRILQLFINLLCELVY